MRVLFITQIVDRTDSNLGAVHTWIEALAKQVEKLHVLALNTGIMELPANVHVHSLCKDRGHGRLRQLATFYSVAGGLALGRQVDVFFPHMVPRYALLVAPFRALLGIPTVMWYAHNSADLKLKLAYRCVDRFVSASADSFPLGAAKCRPVGMGVDTDLFSPPQQAAIVGSETKTSFLSLGRISPRKELDTLILAADWVVNRWKLRDVEFVVAGAPLAPEDHDYLARLKARVRELALENHVRFTGGIPHSETAQQVQACDYFVNMHVEGGLGKAVLEAMSCAKPALVSTATYYDRFPDYGRLFLFEPREAESLALRIRSALELTPDERQRIGDDLRRWVVEEHDVRVQMSRIVEVFRAVGA